MAALGAAYEGLHGEPPFDEKIAYRRLSAAWPELAAYVTVPNTSHAIRAEDVITTLNDSEKWSRERIADWLESIGL